VSTEYVWKPKHRNDHWSVARFHGNTVVEWAYGKDGEPIRFWNEPSAQLKADAMNRREPQ
jgi:hypothetical protein